MIIEQIKKDLNEWVAKQNLTNVNYMLDKIKFNDLGDISSNIALIASKQLKMKPLDVAQGIVSFLSARGWAGVSVSNPGFINFKIEGKLRTTLLDQILNDGNNFGKFPPKPGKYSVEYVSANPTGYLHIGHARNAVLGNCILNLLSWYGHPIVSEYVVNDAGNQMNLLATAVFIRYLQSFKIDIELPKDSYHGEEIIQVADALKEKYKDEFINIKVDEHGRIADAKIEHTVRWFARDYLLEIIKKDLKALGVEIELYFSENQSHQNGMIDKMIERLLKSGVAYKKEGAIWLETTKYGDDKDRVLIKSDGVPTYFAPDIVYHDYKWNTNGTNYLINIWGADHYSYINRMKIAMQCLGYNPDDLIVVCMQMVKLMKDGQPFKMSKRTGDSLTLRDLVEALGKDAARWYLVSQSANNHIMIDVNEATNKNSNNPFFYVQYAYARAHQLIHKQNLPKPAKYDALDTSIEREIITQLEFFKYTIENCALTYEPYKMTVYLLNLAQLFHSYYSNTKVFEEQNPKASEQYYLIKAVMQVIHNGLQILGISVNEKM